MNYSDMDIDWAYLLERVETLMDLGEEYLGRQLAEYEIEAEAFQSTIAFRWQRQATAGWLVPVPFPDTPDHADLLGIDATLQRLNQNTLQFVRGYPANNVLLWGERGSGKSSAVKGLINQFSSQGLRLVEVQKEDLFQLPLITGRLRDLDYRFILFCDDLSFDESEVSYRELKALLEGGIESRPANVLVYATSNRRHLMPERFEDNSMDAEIHPEERIAEKLSLSDRFGITLGFYPMSQETYLAIVRHLSRRRKVKISAKRLEREALQWALRRGARSGRVARQFVDDLSGRLLVEAERKKGGGKQKKPETKPL
ncbi:ATPase [Desulfuromonas sp. AOP6]|nr:ATPase [Desulfuromonas sp. AOP6]